MLKQEAPRAEMIKRYLKELEQLTVRRYIKIAVKNYDEKQTYIIYDGNRIEIFNKEILDILKEQKKINTYLVSYPVEII